MSIDKYNESSILLNLNSINKFNVILKVFIIGIKQKINYTVDGIHIIKITDSFILHLITKKIFRTYSISSVQRSLNGWGCIHITIDNNKYLYHPFFTRYIRDNFPLPSTSKRRKVFSRMHSLKYESLDEINDTILKQLTIDFKSIKINECFIMALKKRYDVKLFNCDMRFNARSNKKRKLNDTDSNKKINEIEDSLLKKKNKAHLLIDETQLTLNIKKKTNMLPHEYVISNMHDIDYHILYHKMKKLNNKIQWEF